jgi:hypothetical protein
MLMYLLALIQPWACLVVETSISETCVLEAPTHMYLWKGLCGYTWGELDSGKFTYNNMYFALPGAMIQTRTIILICLIFSFFALIFEHFNILKSGMVSMVVVVLSVAAMATYDSRLSTTMLIPPQYLMIQYRGFWLTVVGTTFAAANTFIEFHQMIVT